MADSELVPLIEALTPEGIVPEVTRSAVLQGNTFGMGEQLANAEDALHSLVFIIYAQQQTVEEARDTIARLRDEVERLQKERKNQDG